MSGQRERNVRLGLFGVALAGLVVATAACRSQVNDVRTDERPSRSFRFEYEATLRDVPSDAGNARMWVPLPPNTADQTITSLDVRVSNGERWIELPEAQTGVDGEGSDSIRWTRGAIEGGQGQSLCIETPGTPIQLKLAFDVTRHESRGGGEATPAELEAALQPNRMIPLNGNVALAAAAMKTSSDPHTAARQLYDHVLERMRYDKPEAGDWGRGDAEWACDSRFGNCTDFHSYFMGLARAKGIPARFEMGFPVPAGDEARLAIGGYHCWAYFWIDGDGWIPVDISEADKHPKQTDYYFGTLDENRVTMSEGRDLVLEPSTAEPLNFLVYPYAEIDGEPATNIEKSFSRHID